MSNYYLATDIEDMPKEGWIWGCIYCNQCTSRIEKIGGYEVYTCGRCQKFWNYYSKIDHINECKYFLKKICIIFQ